MKELVKINWIMLAAPFLWAFGISIALSLGAIMEYLRIKEGLNRKEFIKKPLHKNCFLLSAGLILLGIVLFPFKIPHDKLIVVQLENRNPNIINKWEGRKLEPPEKSIRFTPDDMKMDAHNKSHILNNEKRKEDTMVLFWDGYIQSPFVKFNPGLYGLTFEAKGSKAEDEYSMIKVEFESPDEKGYLISHAVQYIELSRKFKQYRVKFDTVSEMLGRIRITYFNDVYIPGKKKGRDVWINNISIERE